MAIQAIEAHRANAAISNGAAVCKKNLAEFLKDLNLPLGLLPLNEVEEFGYNKDTGFFWIIQKKKREHTFKKIKETVSYGTEVSGFVEAGKLKSLTGVKVKQLFIWLTINEVYISNTTSDKITFKIGAGLTESFPVSAFDLEA